jgi:hypothetical protein
MDVRRIVFSVIGVMMSATVASAQPQLAVNGTLAPSPVAVQAGSVATITVSSGPGNTTDWIALYPIGAADAAYLDWKYLNGSTAPPASGLTSATIVFPMPVTAGDYEIRLFANNGYQRLATSTVVTVTAATTQITINGTAAPGTVTTSVGMTVSVGVTNGPANSGDWVVLAAAGASDTTFVDWRYLNGATAPPSTGMSSATLTFAAPASPGAYEFRFFVNNSSQRLATSGPLTVTASSAEITVNGGVPPATVSAEAGSVATVAISRGPGNAGDWVALFAANAADTQYLGWQYLNGSTAQPGSGVSDATLSVLLPASPGSYEFRFFSNNGYTRLAISSSVVIAAATAQLAVNGVVTPDSVTVPAGSTATVTVSNGPGNAADWVTLALAGSAETAFVDWRYLNGTTVPPANGLSTATVSFTVPVSAATYEVRLFAANTFERIATSGPVVVAAPSARIAINGVAPPAPVSVVPGSTMSVQLTGGPGNAGDWVALAPSGSPTTTYVAWQYLSGTLTPPQNPLTTATLNFVAPVTPGTYEFRFFAANAYALLTTSAQITVIQSPAQIAVNGVLPPATVTVPAGGVLTVDVSGGPGNATDWVVLAASGGAETSYVSWLYLNGSATAPSSGMTSATLTFSAPSTTGTYQLRLYASNSYARLATSAMVNVGGDSGTSTQVALTGPAPGVTFTGPMVVTVDATVTSNVPIVSVNFYAGTMLIGTSATGPYEVAWPWPAPGSYPLTARATDAVGRLTTSPPVNITIVAAPLVVTTVSPASSAAGTFITITGSGFGGLQGSGSMWLGTKPGVVTTWSNTQITAVVATGSLSGTAFVRQYGTASNSQPFTISKPVLTDVMPVSAASGALVTIIGTGFGNTQGVGQVWLGTVAAAVTSWSDTQIVASVGSGSTSGNAQVLQSGVISNAVSFTVTGNLHIDSIIPDTADPGTPITITGSGFGASAGTGVAWIGGASASISSWTDTEVVAAVPASAVAGVVKILQDGKWTNAVPFTLASANPPSGDIGLIPSVINLVVGETHSIQALNWQNASVSGLVWTTSASGVVALSGDDPPMITALAPGNVVIRAGDASGDVTVHPGSNVPVGTVLWSNPGTLSGVSGIYAAVPSDLGVADVFATQWDDTVQAITSDGTVAWTTSLNEDSFADFFVPDFQGGLVVGNPARVSRLDGLTGLLTQLYATTTDEGLSIGLGHPVVHTDGTVLTFDYSCSSTNCYGNTDAEDAAWVVGINPSTARTPKFKVPTANSVWSNTVNDAPFCGVASGTTTGSYHSWPFPMAIAGDGFAYLGYETFDSTSTVQRAAARPLPDEAYDAFDRLRNETNVSDFTDALDDLKTLRTMGVNNMNVSLENALFNGDRYHAILYENMMADQFNHPCDYTESTITKLHLLRVGSDGSSSDVIVKESVEHYGAVFTPSTEYPFYHETDTKIGPDVRHDLADIITNADAGALYSWTSTNQCYEHSDPGLLPAWREFRQGDPACISGTETHLTTTAGNRVATDVLWDPGVGYIFRPVQPILQLEDGSFAGLASAFSGDVLLVFDKTGDIKWTLPGFEPVLATESGGLIASSGGITYAFDASGSSVGLVPSVPQIQSWIGDAYEIGSIVHRAWSPNRFGSSLWPQRGGNPSGTGPRRVPCDDPPGSGPEDKRQIRSRFFEQLPAIGSIAVQLHMPRDFLTGLSSYESAWLGPHARELGNMWGLTNAGGPNLDFGGSLAAGNTYFVNLANSRGVHDKSTIPSFVFALRAMGYNSVNPTYDTDLTNRIKRIPFWQEMCGVR